MKTITILMLAVMAFALVVPMISAQETKTELEVVEPGIGPDSGLYGLDRAMERLRLAFTMRKAEKAKLKLKYAEERLAEVEDMIVKNLTEEAEEAQEFHDEELNETEELVEEIETDSDEEVAEEALAEVNEIRLGLMNHSERVAYVHNRILERMRLQENVSEEKIAHLEEVFVKIQNKALEMEQKMAQKRENVRTKYKVLSNKTDEEIEEIEEEVLEKLEEIKARRDERVQSREEIKARVQEKIEEVKARVQERIQERVNESQENGKTLEPIQLQKAK